MSVTTREPEFNDDDRARLFVDYEAEHEQKSVTGVPMDVATDPANRGRFTVEAETDFALEARQKMVADYEAKYKAADMAAIVFSVVPPPITE